MDQYFQYFPGAFSRVMNHDESINPSCLVVWSMAFSMAFMTFQKQLGISEYIPTDELKLTHSFHSMIFQSRSTTNQRIS